MTTPTKRDNPFQVTKAVDFSDEEIVRTWVDLPGGGFYQLADPKSPMPRLLLGGKGSGRTHLMRYFSAVSQKIRTPDAVLDSLGNDGYLGIYVRCSGLNSGRFSGKGQSDEAWADVFAYYTDLWLAQHMLMTVLDIFCDTSELREAESAIAEGVLGLFDEPPVLEDASASGITEALHGLQRELDIAVNNASLTQELPVRIRVTRGVLVFDLPGLLASRLPSLQSIQFTYLLDELENLTAAQQRYVNTLIREKRPPCGFMIGSRLYGIRTFETYSSGEENKEGSEFESVYLDRVYLREKDHYNAFCRNLIAHRLADAGYAPHPVTDLIPNLEQYFDHIPEDRLGQSDCSFLLDRPSGDRKYMGRMRDRLTAGLARGRAPGVSDPSQIDEIIAALSLPEAPIVEKLNTFLLYKDWNRNRNLREAASAIAVGASGYVEGDTSGRHQTQMGLFRGDMLAQILREHSQKQRYYGLETFIHMSSGLPRNLVILLKNVFRWSVFDGEEPFGSGPISLAAQREGVLQSSNWFYEDAPGVGEMGREAQASVERLARLMRALRFSDKPVESSLSAFSVDLNALSPQARDTIKAAEQWSMLMPVEEGQRDKNTEAVLPKYQLSGMLAPRFDLPIYRRGTLSLTPSEGNAIFDARLAEEYEAVVRARLARVTAPLFGSATNDSNEEPKPRLF